MSASRQPVQHNNGEPQRVFVDFHNADAQGRLRLNCNGTIEDLAIQRIELQDGQHLVLYSEDLEVDGIVEYSQSEHLWVVVIDWDEIRQVEQEYLLGQKVLVRQKRFDITEKIISSLEIADLDTEQNNKKIEKLLDQVKPLFKDAHALFSREQDISETLFYQQFSVIFGKEEAKEIWAARNWNTNVVLRDLVLVLMNVPEIHDKIEQKSSNLEEMVNRLSQEDEFRRIATELPEIDQKSLARLREVICA